MAERAGLLNRCTGNSVPGVRIPPSPPFQFHFSEACARTPSSDRFCRACVRSAMQSILLSFESALFAVIDTDRFVAVSLILVKHSGSVRVLLKESNAKS